MVPPEQHSCCNRSTTRCPAPSSSAIESWSVGAAMDARLSAPEETSEAPLAVAALAHAMPQCATHQQPRRTASETMESPFNPQRFWAKKPMMHWLLALALVGHRLPVARRLTRPPSGPPPANVKKSSALARMPTRSLQL
eukprot:8570130-Pyramimonas_sp.AAC.1